MKGSRMKKANDEAENDQLVITNDDLRQRINWLEKTVENLERDLEYLRDKLDTHMNSVNDHYYRYD